MLGDAVGLEADHDDIDVAHCLEVVGRGYARSKSPRGDWHPDAVRLQRRELWPAGDQHHLGAASRQRRAHVGADRAAAEDGEAHAQSSPK